VLLDFDMVTEAPRPRPNEVKAEGVLKPLSDLFRCNGRAGEGGAEDLSSEGT